MKKIIAILGLLLTVGIAYGFYYNTTQVAYYTGATVTDTIGPFSADDYENVKFIEYFDLQSSTTITQTITPAVKYGTKLLPIHAAITVASAITADAAKQVVLRNQDTVIVPAPLFWLIRVTTVTGDSVSLYSHVASWKK